MQATISERIICQWDKWRIYRPTLTQEFAVKRAFESLKPFFGKDEIRQNTLRHLCR